MHHDKCFFNTLLGTHESAFRALLCSRIPTCMLSSVFASTLIFCYAGKRVILLGNFGYFGSVQRKCRRVYGESGRDSLTYLLQKGAFSKRSPAAFWKRGNWIQLALQLWVFIYNSRKENQGIHRMRRHSKVFFLEVDRSDLTCR